MRAGLFLFAVVVALAAIAAPPPRSARSQEPPRDVTYTATLAAQGPVREGSGTLLLTLTPDLSAVTRVEVRNTLFEWINSADFTRASVVFSKRTYFSPPVVVKGGEFSLVVGDPYQYEAVRIDGRIADGSVSGTATLFAYFPPSLNRLDLQSFSYSDAAAIDTPPLGSDTIYRGNIEGQDATVTLSTNSAGEITAFLVDNALLDFASCVKPRGTISTHSA